MRTSASEIASPASRRFTLLALAFGLAGTGQAFAADSMPAAMPTHVAMEAAEASSAQAGADWNVDYPSQLGPEGPSSNGARAGDRSVANVRPHGDTAQVRPSASR